MSASTPSPTLTLKDIAREAGVSLATVDRVLHERPGVRPGTVTRVKDTIERHEFHPFAAAADLARGRTNRFAIPARDRTCAAAEMLDAGALIGQVAERYAGWQAPEARAILAGNQSLAKVAGRALMEGLNPQPRSGRQEYLESLVKRFV